MRKKNIVLLLIVACIGTCCTKHFNEFYEDKRGDIRANTVYEYLDNTAKFSDFVGCLKQTKLDSVLKESATVTVFAVENDDMNKIKSLPADSMKLYMQFHVAIGKYFSSDMNYTERIKSLNGKYHAIGPKNGTFQVDKVDVSEEDITCGNGVVQVMDGALKLRDNIYETILKLPEDYSIIREYILDADTMIFDRSNSKPVGINETGNTVYDTVWIHSNSILQGEGDVTKEDDFFTAFIPTNEAVTYAVDKVRQDYENATGAPFEPEVDKMLYEWCHESLFYKGEVADVTADTMLTLTNKAKFKLSVQQVEEASKQATSNGELYSVNYLQVPKYMYMEEVKITPRFIARMDAATRDKYRTRSGGYEELGPGVGWYNLYSLIDSNHNHWASFKTFIYDENDELKDVSIIPGEYDIYVKSTVESYGIWTGGGWHEIWLNEKRLCDREYPAYEYENCTNTGYYLGRDELPEEWGVKQGDLKIVFKRNGNKNWNRMMFDWIKFVPTSNNY
ncbi:fasciclin domain-containing protein [Puteibacter caeruleilacunae]|nr:fasciclin domain-containing protein [Puteibacter caeruleilacunae]